LAETLTERTAFVPFSARAAASTSFAYWISSACVGGVWSYMSRSAFGPLKTLSGSSRPFLLPPGTTFSASMFCSIACFSCASSRTFFVNEIDAPRAAYIVTVTSKEVPDTTLTTSPF